MDCSTRIEPPGGHESDIRNLEGALPRSSNNDLIQLLLAVKEKMEACTQLCTDELAELKKELSEFKEEAAVILALQQPTSGPDGSQQHTGVLKNMQQDLVQAIMTQAIDAVRSDLDQKLACCIESREEVGRSLVKEFERSIVGSHAERLAAVELKLMALGEDVDSPQSLSDIVYPRSSPVKDADSAVHGSSNASYEKVSPDPLQSKYATLEADVDALRADIHRLVSVDLHVLINNVHLLQTTSDEMMDIIEQNKTQFHEQVKRLEENCIEEFAGFRVTLQKEVRDATQKMLQQDGAAFPNMPVDAQQVPSSSSTSGLAQSHGGSLSASTCTGVSSIPLARNHSFGSMVTKDPADTSLVVQDLQNTLLSYFRTEFSDKVTEFLHGIPPPRPTAATQKESVAGSGEHSSKVAVRQGASSRVSPTMDAQEDALPSCDVATERLPLCSQIGHVAGSIQAPAVRISAVPAISTQVPSKNVQTTMPTVRTGSSSVPRSGSTSCSAAQLGASMGKTPPVVASKLVPPSVRQSWPSVSPRARAPMPAPSTHRGCNSQPVLRSEAGGQSSLSPTRPPLILRSGSQPSPAGQVSLPCTPISSPRVTRASPRGSPLGTPLSARR